MSSAMRVPALFHTLSALETTPAQLLAHMNNTVP